MPGPAYRIHTPRLVIRCWSPADAPLLADAITASVEHLRPWMPWVHSEPEELETKVQRLRSFRAKFDQDEDYIYALFSPDEREVLGGTGLHPRVGTDALEIGYWISAPHVGRGLATEAAAALTRVAFEVNGVERMEIRCDPANVRSAAVPAKLGYTHEATLRARVIGGDGALQPGMIWTLLRDEYPATPSAAAPVEAFDAAGRRLL
ncbi:GNAT family protein [Longimicrobium sp.]|uniref:GNAT family N-acetyltransferase n=1 Tax=Longimicrobium sp. TaxID=2029185 RepID=UPI002E302E55|nr:GNAT family protein [Longimicrobium sp.]HEX6038344.1 GNAT family protein [Longimicrobium sp.]